MTVAIALSPGSGGGTGPAGPGVPTGGTTGQVLAKNSNTDYDTIWVPPSGGGASFPTVTVDNVSSSVGRFITSAGRNMVMTTQALTAFRLYHVPFIVTGNATITSLAINVTAAVAASSARCGIYSSSGGYIGSLLTQTADIDTSTTGFKTATLSSPQALTPGLYFADVVANGAITVTAYTSASNNIIGNHPLGIISGGVTVIEFRYEALSSTIVLPSSPSATTTASNVGVTHSPMVFLGTQ